MKRGIGVGTIILLTPAILAAWGATCAITFAVSDGLATGPAWNAIIFTLLGLGVAARLAVMVAMIVWAMRTHRRNKGEA